MAANDIARVYAASLVEIGQKAGILGQISEELKVITQLIQEDENLKNFINSPGISREAKKKLFNNVMAGAFLEQVISFINVLIDHNRLVHIRDISGSIEDQIDEINNIQKVSIISRFKLTDESIAGIRAKLEKTFNKNIIIKQEVDENILGGIIFKVGDTVIDGSLVKDLQRIKLNLLKSEVRSEMAYEN